MLPCYGEFWWLTTATTMTTMPLGVDRFRRAREATGHST